MKASTLKTIPPSEPSALLSALMRQKDFQTQRAAIFPTIDSLRWFIRQNAARLTEQGALLVITGRQLIDPARFDATVLELGRERQRQAVGLGN